MEKPKVVADSREASSVCIYWLQQLVKLEFRQLEVGDYILSERVGVERKQVRDFLTSIFSQRIFDQLERLKESYPRPLLMLEGDPERLWMERRVHPNTIRGVLASIAIDLQIPIIWSGSPKETAEMLYWIAHREQVKLKKEVAVRPGKRRRGLAEEQEFLVAGLPGISTVRARQLLLKFRTPRNVFSASINQLKKVRGVGEKTARQIQEVLDSEYTRQA